MTRSFTFSLVASVAIVCVSMAARAQLIGDSLPAVSADKLAADSIVDTINSEIKHRVAVHTICFNTLWRNTRPGATPAAILAQLGTHAKLVFQFANENLTHIGNCAAMVGKTRADFIPDADCIPPLAFTIHEDGTATLNP